MPLVLIEPKVCVCTCAFAARKLAFQEGKFVRTRRRWGV